MSRVIDLDNLSEEDEKYLADRENIIGVPNVHGYAKGEAPWGPDGSPPVNPGDSNAAQMSYGDDLNTVGDDAHPILTGETNGARTNIERVPLPDVRHPGSQSAFEVGAAKDASRATGDSSDLRNLTVPELRKEAEKRDLHVSGTKVELIERIQDYDTNGQQADADDDD